MTFIDDEYSVEDSRPRELYDIEIDGVVRYRITSGKYNIIWNANTYTAEPLVRTEQAVATTSGDAVMNFMLSLKHPFCARMLQNGIPPDVVVVTIRRLQLRSGETDIQWSGEVGSMSIDGHLGKFSIPSRMQRAMKRKLATVNVSKSCNHVLYGPGCGVYKPSYTVGSFVEILNGRTIHVTNLAIFATAGWANGGIVRHTASGVVRTVLRQDVPGSTNTQFIMQAPIIELAIGDLVEISAGCKHDTTDCETKFNNARRYGGFPELPKGNIFIPGSNIYTARS